MIREATPERCGRDARRRNLPGRSLAQLLAVNADGGPLLLPERIEQTRDEWHATPELGVLRGF